MARQEEIKQAARNIAYSTARTYYVYQKCGGSDAEESFEECYEAALLAAEWSDKHPKKGLIDIDKVCEFLRKKATITNDCNVNIHMNGASYHFVSDFIEDFRKAMED